MKRYQDFITEGNPLRDRRIPLPPARTGKPRGTENEIQETKPKREGIKIGKYFKKKEMPWGDPGGVASDKYDTSNWSDFDLEYYYKTGETPSDYEKRAKWNNSGPYGRAMQDFGSYVRNKEKEVAKAAWRKAKGVARDFGGKMRQRAEDRKRSYDK